MKVEGENGSAAPAAGVTDAYPGCPMKPSTSS
jgi:hypothetical protein